MDTRDNNIITNKNDSKHDVRCQSFLTIEQIIYNLNYIVDNSEKDAVKSTITTFIKENFHSK